MTPLPLNGEGVFHCLEGLWNTYFRFFKIFDKNVILHLRKNDLLVKFNT